MKSQLTAKKAFSAEALRRISAAIAEVEKETNAEIRLSIREDRDEAEAGMEMREIALREFVSLNMHKTKGRTGVLLLILFDEHKFYIYGDEGLTPYADPETWTDVAQTLSQHFKQSDFEQGVIAALQVLRSHVRRALPLTQGDTDELSNEVSIR